MQLKKTTLLLIGVILLVALSTAWLTLTLTPRDERSSDCHEAATELYGKIGALFDQLTQEALLKGGHVGFYQLKADDKIWPEIWRSFVITCLPSPPPERGAS